MDAIDNLVAKAAVEPTQNIGAFGQYLNSLPEDKKARLRKSLDDALAAPAQGLQKDVSGNSGMTTAVGLVPYSLEAPALNLWPVVTPLRNAIPRKVIGGTGHHWKRITAIDTDQDYGFVAENTDTTANSVAGRAGFMKISEVDDSVTFKTLGLDNYITWDARYGGNTTVNSGMDFRPDQVARLAALQALMMREERAILGGNLTQLAAPGAPSKHGTQPAPGVGSLANSTAYKFTVSALTFLGYRKGSDGNDGSNSVGETTAAASTALSTTAGGNAGDKAIALTWTAIPGAVAYNVYGGTNGGDGRVYLGTTTTNRFTVTSVTGLNANVPNLANTTVDTNGYNGLIKLFATLGGYIKSLDGEALTGTKNYIAELDAAFQSFFTTYQLGPTRIFMAPADIRKAIDVVTGSSAPYVRLEAKGGDMNFVGGLGVSGVLNNYTNQRVDFEVHPYMPPGTMLLWCDNFGQYYPNVNIPNPVEMLLAYDYISVDWAPTSLRQEFGTYVKGAPTLRAGFPMGIIYNVG